MEKLLYLRQKDFGCSTESDIPMMLEMAPEIQNFNEAGHVQELQRNFSLLSTCSVGIVTGNTWAALGGTIAIAIYNGGPPGVIYEFMVVSIFYWLVAASLAELASSIPSSAGVYHWASITPGPRYGRICGFFAGWWNFFAWNFACASMSSIMASVVIAIYAMYHPSYLYLRWHSFVAYVISTWFCCAVVLFANRLLPVINKIGLCLVLGGVLVTVLVCAVMPKTTGTGHATTFFVWAGWSNQSGYKSDGFTFLAGMLNGAFAVGTPDCVSHLSEEIPNPKLNVPRAIAAQMVIGSLMALFYIIAIFYATTNIDRVLESPMLSIFPLAEIYLQATSSSAGSCALLLILLCPVIITCISTYLTAGRTFWALARDDATPFSSTFRAVSSRFKNPFRATVLCGCITTALGAINIGSTTAFQAFVGSFVILSSLSYLAAILPFVISGRFGSPIEEGSQQVGGSGMRPGPFQMSRGLGYTVNIVSCLYITVFVVVYCFPYSLPVTFENMNYSCVTTGGLSIFIFIWWLGRYGAKNRYIGPNSRSNARNALNLSLESINV